MSKAPAFQNLYTTLPDHFFHRQGADTVPAPELIAVNDELAKFLEIDAEWLRSAAGLDMLSGKAFPDSADPIATVYAGFQFGNWNPQLGDGRALLIGEVIAQNQQRYDVQLKGSGRTPYSRGGDGKSPLGPVLREYLLSEAMHTLGVPTTRALAAVTTGEEVYRDSALPGAILTRVASSHIRVGTVQFFASRKDTDGLRALCDHVIERHYPDCRESDNPTQALLRNIIERQAKLIAKWQGLGFIHGVMNTDNMLLCGETVDYGPCAFMEAFDPATVFSSIDHGGRYAYGNQPHIGHWNLAGLAQALLPLLHDDEDEAVKIAQAEINSYPDLHVAAYQHVLTRKLGLSDYRDEDDALVTDLLELLKTERADFTLAFRRLYERAAGTSSVKTLWDFSPAFDSWLARWQTRFADSTQPESERIETMRTSNPLFIPRNHRVEEAIQAGNQGDFSVFHTLREVLREPFTDNPDNLDYARPAAPQEVVKQTFCGT
ncbi:uncharacterized protein YdiU (UPF0061 family) [Litorivivens lipolytica]|uniref:Protein nucleotidyltransferase YdiU n=1 Tax=Litorivivens lipolytica TaxID=1524264 RepID=A0A7W4Z6N5_9GAMM|nr:YdiU family protein [Litorivivens lipolytica]MBB3048483.1 uncharacterized protein YdiU (UPF0061 family) [Litorivivens lipolytica]